MELTGALDAARARCSPARHPSTSQPTGPARSHHPPSRVFLWRNTGALRKNGLAICPCSAPALPATGGAWRPRRGRLLRARAAAKSGDAEVVDEEVLESGAEGGKQDPVEKKSDEEEFGIDADGNLTASLPPEFLELMKDEGPPPNYLLAGFGITVAFLARKAIWKEVKLWGKLALASGELAVAMVASAAVKVFQKLLIWGGDPLAKVIISMAYVGLGIHNVFKFIADIVSPLPVLFAVTLASVVLLVGESVSGTFKPSETEFPSRAVLDTAGLLGLGGFVGVIPVEVTLLGIVAITLFLLFVRKVNLVAGFTPAVAVFAAVAEPVIRYPVFLAFVGLSTYRYWRLGYMSSGAVQKERTAEYPRLLIALLYLAAVAFAARSFFFAVGVIRIALSPAPV